MSIFNAPSFYSAPDRQTYSAGNYFIPQEKYTFGDVPKYLMPSGITATTAANVIPPILPINQGGGGDGSGPPPGDDEDEDPYSDSPYDQYGNLKGTMTPFGALKNTFAFMTNPLGYIGYNAYKEFQRARQQKQFEKELQNPDFKDMVAENRAGRTGGYQAGYDSGFMDGPSGAGRGNNPGDKGGSDTMGSHAYGGRVGYMMGGLANLVDIYD